MRLFLAIELPANARAHLARVQDALKTELPGAAFTRAENLHMTLKFLGEADAKKQEALVESIGRIHVDPFDLAAETLDCFPSRGPIRIVAAALSGAAALRALHESIEQRCKFLGYQREQRAFRPHVTLARARPVLPARFRQPAADATAALLPGPAFAPAEFVLMQSRLDTAGAKYIMQARFSIG
jgi:2'-5' RNA ligase